MSRTGAINKITPQVRRNKVLSQSASLDLEVGTYKGRSGTLIASGISYVVENAEFFNPWLQLQAYPVLAYYSKREHPVHVIGELLASWSVKTISEEEIETARSNLYKVATNCFYRTDLFIRVAEFIMTKIKNALSDIVVSKEYFCNSLGIQPREDMLDNYPLQKLVWMEVRGNVFKWDELGYPVTLHPTWLTVVKNLNAIDNDQYQNIPTLQFVETAVSIRGRTQNKQENLANHSVDTILGFVETLSMVEADTICRTIIEASTVILLYITNGQYRSDEWFNNKIDKITSIYEGTNLKYATTRSMMKQFNRRYKITTITNSNLHCIIQALFVWSDEKSADAVSWIIEETIMSKIASIVFFAEAMTERNTNFLQYLMATIAMTEFANLASQIGCILHDRYSIIRGLNVPLNKYSSLLYIGKCAYLRKTCSSSNLYKRHKPHNTNLDIIVNLIDDFNKNVIGEEQFLINLMKICSSKKIFRKCHQVNTYRESAKALYFLLEKLLEAHKEDKFRSLKRNGSIGYTWKSKLSDDTIQALLTLNVPVSQTWLEDDSQFCNLDSFEATEYDVLSRMVFQ